MVHIYIYIKHRDLVLNLLNGVNREINMKLIKMNVTTLFKAQKCKCMKNKFMALTL